jgi:hypothetical protein
VNTALAARQPVSLNASPGETFRVIAAKRLTRVQPLHARDFVDLDADDHTAGLQAWLNASQDGTPLHLDAAEYRVTARLLATGRTAPLTVTGDGSSTTSIRRVDGTVTGNGGVNRMLEVSNATGRRVTARLTGFTLDHNATGNPFGENEDGFAWEQSSAIAFAPNGERAMNVIIDDLRCLDPIADFLNFAGSASGFNRVDLGGLHVPERHRQRFDVTVSAHWHTFTLRDSNLTSVRFEMSGVAVTPYHYDIAVSGVTVRPTPFTNANFALAVSGGYALDRKPVHTVTGCDLDGKFSFSGADLTVSDGSMTVRSTTTTGQVRLLSGAQTFERLAVDAPSAEFETGVFVSAGEATPGRVTLKDCALTSAGLSTQRWFRLTNPAGEAGGLTLEKVQIGGDMVVQVASGQHVFRRVDFLGSPPGGVYIRVEAPLTHATVVTLDNTTFADPTAPVTAPEGVTVTAL